MSKYLTPVQIDQYRGSHLFCWQLKNDLLSPLPREIDIILLTKNIKEIFFDHNREEWWHFIDSSRVSLKIVLWQNKN